MLSVSKLLLATILCIAATEGVVIKCDFSVTFWDSVGFCYHCRATIVNTANSTELTGVQGYHLWGQGNNQVLSLSLAGQNAPKILKNIDKFFPNLIALDWFSTNLQAISASDIKQFAKLKVLSVSGNKITSLEGQLFSNTKKLQSIYFNNNQLRTVGAGIFAGLGDLTHAEFLNNPCISVKAVGSSSVKKLGEQLPKSCPVPATTTTTTTKKPTTTTQKTTTTRQPPTTTRTTTQKTTTTRQPPTTTRTTTQTTTTTRQPPTTTQTTSQKTTTTREPSTTTQTSTTTPLSTISTTRVTSTTTTEAPTTTTQTKSTTTAELTTQTVGNTTSLKTTTTTRPTTTRPVLDCNLSSSGVAPHPSDCTKYYECVRGIQYERTCPEGQIFDIRSLRCGDIENSVCAH